MAQRSDAELEGAVGDWKGCGYSRERAHRLADRIEEIQADGATYERALLDATEEIQPDLF